MKAIQPSRAFHLRNWSIGAKLTASFGLIILVTIGLATTSWFSLLSVQRTLDKALNEGLQIEVLGDRIQDRLSGARRQEQAFLLHWQDEGYQNAVGMYLMPRGSYISDMRRAIDRLGNLTASEQTEFSLDINAESRQLMAALEIYDTEFDLITNLLMDRGMNQSGAIGDLEIVSLELAAELETLGQLELINIFLRLRLNEKQYRLLSEQQYSEQMSLALQELRATLARVAPAESERLVPLLDRYEQAFDELNRLDAEIASHVDRYTAAAEAIQSLAFNIAADGAELADEELKSVAESVQRAHIALILAITVAAALSVVLSIVLTRQISRPMRVLTDTAMEIRRGNLAAQAHVESGDEVGTLATVFNSMTDQLRQALKDLEQRVAERTAELTTTNEQLQREVVERKWAEEELGESEEKYRNLVERANDGIVIIQDILLKYVNPRLAETIGYTVEELTGTSFTDYVHSEELPKAVDRYKRRMAGEDVTPTYETVLRHRDGSKIYVEINAGIITYQERPADLVIVRNITGRKRVEGEIRKLNQFLDSVVDNANVWLDVLDEKANVVIWNKAAEEISGYSREEVVGHGKIWEWLYPDQEYRNEVIAEAVVIIETGGEEEDAETIIRRKDGQTRIISWNSRTLVDEKGNPIGSIALGRDITERKRAEEQLQRYAAELEERNEEVKRFAYIVSHDLRAPLVNLKGFATELRYASEVIDAAMDTALPHLDEKQRLAVTTALQEDVPEALGFINSSVTRMDDFVNAVLKLSRLGRRELHLEPVDMEALVQATLETLAHQIEERQVKVTMESLPQVVSDRTSMEQIMGNLLNNAVLYLAPDRSGEIEITGERDHDETTFYVRDNGRGIAEEDMAKVFAPFRRAGKQDVSGEGMGLPYVQTLVRRHGGRIWCESEVGVGTTFAFTLSNHLAGDL